MMERAFYMELREIITGKTLAEAVGTRSIGMPPAQTLTPEALEKSIEKTLETNADEDFYGDSEYDDDELEIAMANATLSNDNELIVAGEQDTDEHVLMDSEGERLGGIGAQSAYPHFCLFSADDTQLITNSCHLYNGVTIGVDRALLKRGLKVEAYSYDEEGEKNFTLIDDAMRVYAGVATRDFYILGDAYGYIKAVGKDGRKIWRHYLGGTIKSMAISDDGKGFQSRL